MIGFRQVAGLTAVLHTRTLELQSLQLSCGTAMHELTRAAHAERQAAAAATAAAAAGQEQLEAELAGHRGAAEQELQRRVAAEEALEQHAEARPPWVPVKLIIHYRGVSGKMNPCGD